MYDGVCELQLRGARILHNFVSCWIGLGHFSFFAVFFFSGVILEPKKRLLFKYGRKGDSLFPFFEQQTQTNKKLHAERRMETLVLLGKLSRCTQTKHNRRRATKTEYRGWQAGNRKQIFYILSNWEAEKSASAVCSDAYLSYTFCVKICNKTRTKIFSVVSGFACDRMNNE